MILRALPALLFGAIVLVAAPAGALLEDTVDSTTSALDTTVDDTNEPVDDTTETVNDTTESVDDTTEPIEDTAEETLPSSGDSSSDDEDPNSNSSDDDSTDPDSSSSSDDGSDSGDDGSSDGSDSTSDDGDSSSGDGSKLSPELQKALTGDSGDKDATFDPTREDAVDTDGDGIPDAYASDAAASGSHAVEPGPQNASGQSTPDTQFVEAPGVATLACFAAVGLALVACVRRR